MVKTVIKKLTKTIKAGGIICAILSANLVCRAEGAVTGPAFQLENPRIAVEIDRQTGAIRSIRDKEQGITYPFSGIGFEVATAAGSVRAEKAAKVGTNKDGAELRFTAGGLEIKLLYSLGSEDRFIEKWLEIKSTDGKPYFLESVILEDLSTEAFSEIHFHDDKTIWHCPINLFLRGDKDGCYAGLEYPYWDLKQKGKGGFRLGYRPNYQAGTGETNVSEKYFIGVYRKEGIHRVSQGPYPGRGRSPFVTWKGTGLSQHFKGPIPQPIKDVPLETLDWGEVWAMQEFMRRILPDDLRLPEDGYWIWQNGWWAGLWNPRIEILDTLKTAGIPDIATAHVWYGRGVHPNPEPYLTQMRIEPIGFPRDVAVAGMPGPAGPAAGWHAPREVKLNQFTPGQFTPDFRAPPAMEKFIEYGRKIGVQVSSFATPAIWFDRKPEWGSIDEAGKPSEYLFGRKVSCWADDDYMRHMLALHEIVFDKYQPRSWGWDGRMLSYWEGAAYRPGPQGVGLDPCYAENHGHLPGDNLYKEWRNIKTFLRELRRRHPRMCLEQYYGLHRGQPWIIRHLNAVYPYYETHGIDMNRLQAWHQQNDRFHPVYKNTCDLFGKEPRDFQCSLITALSMSSYCMNGPAYYALELKENREFLKKWRAWATENHAYLKVKRDLFDCPGDSAVDGSAHIIKDRGFLFLFPGGFDKKVKHKKILRVSVPINRWLQLDEKPSALYQIRELHPREGTDLGIYRYGEEFLYDMPHSPVILALEPVASGSRPRRPALGSPQDQVLVVPAFTSAVKAGQEKTEPVVQ